MTNKLEQIALGFDILRVYKTSDIGVFNGYNYEYQISVYVEDLRAVEIEKLHDLGWKIFSLPKKSAFKFNVIYESENE